MFKKTNKFFRNIITPDPFNKLNNYGLVRKVSNKCANNVTKSLLNNLSYKTSGLFYDRKKDRPYKGSIIYTIFHILYSFLLMLLVSRIVVNFLS